MNRPERWGFLAYRPSTLLKVTGADALPFLQGQFTNDLRSLVDGAAVYGLWLNQKGKVLADSFVARGKGSGEFLMVSYFSAAVIVRERLEAYVIADDVVIEDISASWSGVSIVAASGGGSRLAPPDFVLAFFGQRNRGESFEWLFPTERTPEIRARLATTGIPQLSEAEMEYFRISAGIPSIPRDIGPAELPNEGGLETSAISYTKGCYLGQEVMARLKSMGQVRRRLLRVRSMAGSIPSLPAPLFADQRNVGELRSAVADPAGGFIGLALLSLLHVSSESALAFEADGLPGVRIASGQLKA